MAQEQHGSAARRNWNIRLRIGLLLVSCIMLSYYFAVFSGMIPPERDSIFHQPEYMIGILDSSKTTLVYITSPEFDSLWFHCAIGLSVIALFPLPFSWYTWLFFFCYIAVMSAFPVI